MSKKKNSEQYKDEILEKYNNGQSIRSIASEYGMNHTSISALIRKYQELRVPRAKQEEVLNQIYPLHSQGYTMKEIAKTLGIGTTVVVNYLALNHNVESSTGKRLKYEHLLETFKEEYLRGDSLTEISERHDVPRQTILSYLNRQGVKAREYREASRVYELNEDYFDALTKKKSFQLGIIYAYGSIISKRHANVIRLSRKQGEEGLFVEALEGVTSGIEQRIYLSRPNSNISVAFFELFSDKICGWLEKNDFPNQLPKEFGFDEDEFWKGFLTARASFSKTKRNIIQLPFPTEGLKEAFVKYNKRLNKESETYLAGRDKKRIEIGNRVYLKDFIRRFPFLLDMVKEEHIGLYELKEKGFFD